MTVFLLRDFTTTVRSRRPSTKIRAFGHPSHGFAATVTVTEPDPETTYETVEPLVFNTFGAAVAGTATSATRMTAPVTAVKSRFMPVHMRRHNENAPPERLGSGSDGAQTHDAGQTTLS
ncbi:hypothetical protein [Aeromicrobium sp. 179-A 4D2 NHS]|uniref:hypothetical protein n=1 Tax=Aeromicrobium sp. 179-A 4D2 NHS TaxID=3142375 RepID=UPI0039A15599